MTADQSDKVLKHTCNEMGWNGCEACLDDLLWEAKSNSGEDTYHYGEWDDP